MKILVVSDKESKALWDYYKPGALDGIDLIISCGDLAPEYLSFLVTMTSVPVLYVHGNHDTKYQKFPPEGCICIEDTVYVHDGIRIVGLGGSMRYKTGDHQYTEREMKKRARRLRFKLWRHKGFDILVSHAPAFGINDGEDLPHRGFQTFVELMDKYKPRYFLHGHVHMHYGRKHKRFDRYGGTCIVNAYEKCVFDYDSPFPDAENIL